jgi:hypothetical protein
MGERGGVGTLFLKSLGCLVAYISWLELTHPPAKESGKCSLAACFGRRGNDVGEQQTLT